MIIPEQNGKGTVSFQVSRVRVFVLLAGIAVIMAISVFLMYKSAQVARKLHYYTTLQSDNDQLLKENKQLHHIHQKFMHMDSIATYLEQLSAVERPPVTEAVAARSATDTKTMVPADKKAESRVDKIPSVLPIEGWITQQFTKDTTQESGAHPGIDIAAPEGTIIKAPAPGTVIAVLQDVDYGTMVVLQHEEGFVTRYGHCAKAIVAKNEKIDRGQAIALVGNTGHSSAPHLHYEVLKDGKNVDPQQYITPRVKPDK
jgi:murein DD-endopeptidase MepM/ murein hydrolase activator NlpD